MSASERELTPDWVNASLFSWERKSSFKWTRVVRGMTSKIIFTNFTTYTPQSQPLSCLGTSPLTILPPERTEQASLCQNLVSCALAIHSTGTYKKSIIAFHLEIIPYTTQLTVSANRRFCGWNVSWGSPCAVCRSGLSSGLPPRPHHRVLGACTEWPPCAERDATISRQVTTMHTHGRGEISHHDMPRMCNDGQTPVHWLVNGDWDEVLLESVEFLSPAGHQCVAIILLVALLLQLHVELTTECMHAALFTRKQFEHEMLHAQVNEVVGEVLALRQLLHVLSSGRYHILYNKRWRRASRRMDSEYTVT